MSRPARLNRSAESAHSHDRTREQREGVPRGDRESDLCEHRELGGLTAHRGQRVLAPRLLRAAVVRSHRLRIGPHWLCSKTLDFARWHMPLVHRRGRDIRAGIACRGGAWGCRALAAQCSSYIAYLCRRVRPNMVAQQSVDMHTHDQTHSTSPRRGRPVPSLSSPAAGPGSTTSTVIRRAGASSAVEQR